MGSGCLLTGPLKEVEAGSGTSPEELLLLCSHLGLSNFPSRTPKIRVSRRSRCSVHWVESCQAGQGNCAEKHVVGLQKGKGALRELCVPQLFVCFSY